MKGVSTVLATLLMLIITIALAGVAYAYISGVFTSRTAVVLDVTSIDCDGGATSADAINVEVRNEGTSTSGVVTVRARDPANVDAGSCTIASINAGTTGTCSINRAAGTAAGTYRVTVSAPSAASTRVFATCSTPGA